MSFLYIDSSIQLIFSKTFTQAQHMLSNLLVPWARGQWIYQGRFHDCSMPWFDQKRARYARLHQAQAHLDWMHRVALYIFIIYLFYWIFTYGAFVRRINCRYKVQIIFAHTVLYVHCTISIISLYLQFILNIVIFVCNSKLYFLSGHVGDEKKTFFVIGIQI